MQAAVRERLDMRVVSDISVMQLDEIVAELPPEDRLAFERVFHVGVSYGDLVPPETMHAWIEKNFGSVDLVRRQKIVKVTNTTTLEGVLFNWLRSSRPMWHQELDLDAELDHTNHDPLQDPYNGTPEDIFGRVRGKHCVTASKVGGFR